MPFLPPSPFPRDRPNYFLAFAFFWVLLTRQSLSRKKKAPLWNEREAWLNLLKLHARAGRIVYGLPWDTSAEDVLTRTGWDSLETMYKVRLTEFVFKCMKGFTVTEFKDLFIQRKSGRRRKDDIILPRPETNFIRNSISYRGAIAWNSLTNKETMAKTLKDFKRCLRKFDTDKINFEPILAITNNRDTDYKYFW